jgi:hypothetical protein
MYCVPLLKKYGKKVFECKICHQKILKQALKFNFRGFQDVILFDSKIGILFYIHIQSSKTFNNP